MSIVWRLFRSVARRYPSLLALAGPSALTTVIANWVALLTVGWALIYWPRLSEQFLLAPGLEPSEQQGFVGALYLSLVTLSTLGYGNIAPTSDLLRVPVPLEALIGFGLLTSSLTWVVSIYPPLTKRRSLAQQIALVRAAESETGISVTQIGAEAAERRLEALTSQLVTVRSDLVQFPITYYFHSGDERSSLPANMQTLAAWRKRVPTRTTPGDSSERWRAARRHTRLLGHDRIQLPRSLVGPARRDPESLRPRPPPRYVRAIEGDLANSSGSRRVGFREDLF